uniref:25 kDa core protein OPG138 n=1 Tax=Sheeppox virus TaxID=10266 RepID=A0A218NAC0_SHEV|nr:virion core protein [Sheeppox virus]
MSDKKLSRSSYDDYIETINKLTPQLRTILAHISGEQASQKSNLTPEDNTTNNIDENEVKAGNVKTKTCITKPNKKSKSCINKQTTSRSGNVSSSKSVNNGAVFKKRNTFNETDQVMQAVTNGGKIVYGTMKEGKLEVQGMVGEINQDLLGIESVNAGRRNKNISQSKKKLIKRGMYKVETADDSIDDGMD